MTRARTLADLGSQSLATDAELAAEVATLTSAIGGLTSGKVLQVVRATDTTRRSTTTFSSWVDVAGMSVTITPTQSTSNILVIAKFKGGYERSSAGSCPARYQLVNATSSISGAEDFGHYVEGVVAWTGDLTGFGFDSPATTSAVTYKMQFRCGTSTGGTVFALNDSATGQMFAFELDA